MVLIAVETTWDADNDRISRAVVTSTDNMLVGIVVGRTGDGPSDWEPLYFIDREAGRRELPSCFSLSTEAIEALNLMTIRDRS